jgi:hypothetical protein
MDITSNVFSECIIRIYGGEFLDKNNILWKVVNGQWIGKRSVWTKDWRACWLEDTEIDNIESWWSGSKDADYNEIFYRE